MVLYNVDEVKNLINEQKKLILAADEKQLEQLPEGHWIGGTIPYFMAENGGLVTKDKIFVTELPSYIKKITLMTYNENSISGVYRNAPANGFTVIIIPAQSPLHMSFALNAPSYSGFAASPLIGWISGVHLDEVGKKKAKVFFGEKGKIFDDHAVAMHIELPQNKYAEINIVNIFKQGTGDTITFDVNSFSIVDAYINGEKKNFLEYIKARNLDIKLPLVANYSGAMINTSIQGTDEAAQRVDFYAPVFKGIQYKHAAPVKDYVSEFMKQMPTKDADKIIFSCNCILNYLYSELEGKSTGGITGPITFGEIAYQLLNQTMAYITVSDI